MSASNHGRAGGLDLLRLLAALSVVLYHYTFHGPGAENLTWLSMPLIAPVTKYGYLGVSLFFVISGFVIAYSAEGRSAREFFIARAARIYPGFLVCMTLTFAIIVAFGAPRLETSLVQWAANLAIAAPALGQPYMDSAYWSIVYELVFYGWVMAFIATGLFARRLLPLVTGWLILSVANELLLDLTLVRKLLITDQSGFSAAGLALYAIFAGRRDTAVWALLLAATGLAAFQADLSAIWLRENSIVPVSEAVAVVAAVGAVGLVGAFLLIRKLPVPSSVLIAVGGLTYPLYLTHQYIGYVTFNHLQGVAPPAVLVPVVIVIMLSLAWLLYRFVERPAQRIAKIGLSRLLTRPVLDDQLLQHDVALLAQMARAGLPLPEGAPSEKQNKAA